MRGSQKMVEDSDLFCGENSNFRKKKARYSQKL